MLKDDSEVYDIQPFCIRMLTHDEIDAAKALIVDLFDEVGIY